MTEKKAKKRRAKRLTEIVDFSDCLDVREWLAVRAKANHRNLGQEITYRLSAAKRSSEAGAKNLLVNAIPGLGPALQAAAQEQAAAPETPVAVEPTTE